MSLDNFNLFNSHEDDNNIIYRDLILLCLFSILASFILSLMFMNPPTKKSVADAPPLGAVMVEMIWSNEHNSDLDLWVLAPGDVPVGYYNKNGKIFNLLRDDLGNYRDISNLNYENAVSRGIAPGRYIVNVQFFRCHDNKRPVSVQIIVSTKDPNNPNSDMKRILNKKVEVIKEGDEITVARFMLDEKGKLVPNSVDNLQTPLAKLQRMNGPINQPPAPTSASE